MPKYTSGAELFHDDTMVGDRFTKHETALQAVLPGGEQIEALRIVLYKYPPEAEGEPERYYVVVETDTMLHSTDGQRITKEWYDHLRSLHTWED